MRSFLFALVIIVFLDTFVQFPIISPYAEELGSTPMLIGLVVGMYSVTNLFGNVLAGKWIDQFGAKRILIIGMMTSVVALFLYTLVSTPLQLVVARSIHGFTSGMLVPSIFTVVARQGGGNTRQGRNMAYSGAAVGLAAVIGPAMGGIIKAQFGIGMVFIIVAVLMLIATVISLRVVPSVMPKKAVLSEASKTEGKWGELLRNRALIQACMGAFGLMFTMGVLTFMLPLKNQNLMFAEQSAGFMLSTFGIVAILFFVLPINKYYDLIPSKILMTNGMVVITIALLMLSHLSNEIALYSALGVYGVGFALLFPSMNALLVENVSEHDRGKAFGIFYAVYSIGVVVGSFTVGAVGATPESGFQLAAVVVALFAVIMILFRIVETNKRPI